MITRSSLIPIGIISAAMTTSASALAQMLPLDDAYLIVSQLNGYVIDISGGSTANGTALDSYPQNTPLGSPNQLWTEVRDDVTGYDYIMSLMDGDVIDISGTPMSVPGELDAYPRKSWTTGNPSNQLWKSVPDPAGSGYDFLQGYLSSNVIDIVDGLSNPGQPLDAYPMKSSGYSNQLWRFVKVNLDPVATCTIQTGSFPNQVCQDYLESATGFWLPACWESDACETNGVTTTQLCPNGCSYGCSWGQDYNHQNCSFSSYPN